MFYLLPLPCETQLILARRADTWDGPYVELVGFVVLDCGITLSVSCCLRQPRIVFGASLSFTLAVRR